MADDLIPPPDVIRARIREAEREASLLRALLRVACRAERERPARGDRGATAKRPVGQAVAS